MIPGGSLKLSAATRGTARAGSELGLLHQLWSRKRSNTEGKGLTEKISRRSRFLVDDSRERICCGSHWSRRASKLSDRTRKYTKGTAGCPWICLHCMQWFAWCWELYLQIHLFHPLRQQFPLSVCTASVTGCRCTLFHNCDTHSTSKKSSNIWPCENFKHWTMVCEKM